MAAAEQEMHDQLVTYLPEVVVITRWRCLDDLPWDVEFTSELSSVSPA